MPTINSKNRQSKKAVAFIYLLYHLGVLSKEEVEKLTKD
jgi:hypothetical protein